MYTIAKINNDIAFSGLFGNPSQPIIFVTDIIFETENQANDYIKTVLQKLLDKKANTLFKSGTEHEKDEWSTILEKDKSACMCTETYIVIPVINQVQLLGRPENLY